MRDTASAADTGAAADTKAANAGGHGRRFWFNLLALLLLAPFATWWFQRHLQSYFTEIVLIGGGITLWAALRLMWGLAEKLAKLDPIGASRRLLASPEATLLLVVAAIGLLVLWRSTASLYFEHAGGASADKEFVVQVAYKESGAPYLPDIALGPATRVAGRPFFWLGDAVPLECTIVKPLRFEPLDCSIERGRSTRIRVPAGFTEKSFHLLRIVPGRGLYRQLPDVRDDPVTRYRLQLSVGGRTHVLDDLRKQTVYAGGAGRNLDLVFGLENAESYERFLGTELRAADLDEAGSTRMAAVLASRTRRWDAFDARPGQQLTFMLTSTRSENGRSDSRNEEGFPIQYTVSDDKVQTIWIPEQ